MVNRNQRCPLLVVVLSVVTLLMCVASHSADAQTFGPYYTSFGDNDELQVTWRIEKSDPTKNGDDTVYITMSLLPKYNWMTFGFMETQYDKPDAEDDPIPMDFVFVLRDRKGKTKVKDGVSTAQRIIIDTHKDIFVSDDQTTRHGGIHLTVYRKLKTGDRTSDAVLKAGTMTLTHCFGHSRNMRNIQQIFHDCRDMKDIVFVPPEFYGDGIPVSPTQPPRAPEVAQTMPPSESIIVETHSAPRATESAPMEVMTQSEMRSTLKADGADVYNGRGKIQPLESVNDHTRLVIVKVPQNCTVSPKERSWYEALQMRENSMYYAVIGTSALLTGVIVLFIACCCARNTSVIPRESKKSKVAFYKVDDYEDEHVEFLKENS